MYKILISFTLSLLFFIACTTIQPTLKEFSSSKYEVEEGEEITIKWDVADATKLSITGIGNDLDFKGSKKITISQTTDFTMNYYSKSQDYTSSIKVKVLPKKKEEKPKSIPIKEEKNNTPSKYLKGIINAENVNKDDNLYLKINLINSTNYPKIIELYCTIQDQFGNHVANLAPPYNNDYVSAWKKLFESYNGNEINIENFKVEEIRQDIAPPISSSFVLDYSGSMYEDISLLERAVSNALKYIRKGKDDFEIIQFDHRIYYSVPTSNSSSDLSKIINQEQLMGGTAFYSAGVIGVENLRNSSKEKILILFTDGGDNSSIYNAFDLITKARTYNVKTFVIGFNRQFGGYLEYILEGIANQTGGKTYFPQNISDLNYIFDDIYRLITVYYKVSYETQENDNNIRMVKLDFEFPYFTKKLSATKSYYVKPEMIKEKRQITLAFFDNAKSTIKEDFMPKIKEFATFLVNNPEKQIEIFGHTDSKGSHSINDKLSKKRAEALAQIFYELGVKKSQIKIIQGKGKREPIYPNELNEYQKNENRRVEVIIT